MNRKIIFIAILLVAVLALFAGCKKKSEVETSNGLRFVSNGDGTCYISESRNFTGTNIPATSPDGDVVTSIGDGAFSGCADLTGITIPNGVTSIGNNAFEDCTGLISISIPNSVTSIGRYAFYGCKGLTGITIPNGVTSIGSYAFEGCLGLTSVTIPSSVTSIGSNAFAWCSKLIEVHNLSSLEITSDDSESGHYIKHVYKDGESYLHTTDDGYLFYDDGTEVYLMAYTGNQTNLTLPANYDGKNYTIYQYAFYGCSGLTGITIPNSVTNIGNYAFYRCSGLTGIEIPDSVTRIGSCAFYACNGLESMTIPFVGASKNETSHSYFGYIFGASSYGWNSSYVPASLKTVVITGGMSIGNSAFSGCKGLTDISIPNSVTSIDSAAFSGCTELTSITIPDSVTSLGRSAFSGCTGLTRVTLSNSVTSIEEKTFENCKALMSITIPIGVTSIGNNAFDGCAGLKSVAIPNSVTSIGNSAFYKCSGLADVYYQGTEDAWNAISKGINWNVSIGNYTMHYNA